MSRILQDDDVVVDWLTLVLRPAGTETPKGRVAAIGEAAASTIKDVNFMVSK